MQQTTTVDRRSVRRPLLAGAAVLGGLALTNNLLATRAKRRHPPLGRFVEVDGVKLHVLERGSGPVILLVHGNGTMIEDWIISGLLDDLAATHRVIAVDRPGFGHSERPRGTSWTPQRQAALFSRLLEQLEVGRATVVGHSHGALTVVAMALNHPERLAGAVLLAGYYYPTARVDVLAVAPAAVPGIGDVMRHTVSPMLGRASRKLMEARIFRPAGTTQGWRDQFPWEMALRPSRIRAGAADAVHMIPAAARLASDWSRIDVPVTIVAGEGDLMVHTPTHSEQLHAALPTSRLLLIPGVGHMVHHNAPGDVAAAIRAA